MFDTLRLGEGWQELLREGKCEVADCRGWVRFAGFRGGWTRWLKVVGLLVHHDSEKGDQYICETPNEKLTVLGKMYRTEYRPPDREESQDEQKG